MSSILPYVFRDLAKSMRMMENQLRLTEDLFHPLAGNVMLRRNRRADTETESEVALVKDKDNFQIKLNVQNFAPEEISVKAIDDNAIQIEGKHEEKDEKEGGYICRQFVRRYSLPKGVNLKDVVSSLSSDGVLTIKTPVKETPIPIAYSGANHEQKKE